MHIRQRVYFGKYKGLSVIDVFRGTLNIDRSLLKAYVDFILNTEVRFDYEGCLSSMPIQLIDNFEITKKDIKAFIFCEKGINTNEFPYGSLEELHEDIGSELDLSLTECNQKKGQEIGASSPCLSSTEGLEEDWWWEQTPSTYAGALNTVGALQASSFAVNIPGRVRFEVRKVTAHNARLNIDDFFVTPFGTFFPDNDHLSLGNPNNAMSDVLAYEERQQSGF
ncbi:hypothetical protein [Rufibacter sp. XAAS-G3-1]|uniref:hypothetical protein n=1 Tax=Rufibacter sp. XAAS-G3-1 TaxID=2729134 RepID=UPI0015E7C106|nr:hypothetical protein [Rufibacter sp. XAAS-G3-1]